MINVYVCVIGGYLIGGYLIRSLKHVMIQEKQYDIEKSKNLDQIIQLIRVQENKLVGKNSHQLVDDQNYINKDVYFYPK